ncbi:hypothetical protein [Brachyspira alvinipulli]|uniref:hypothetical protein n=1 Tax=Brachyspira alvinipulli TaxID=84379 RepID=UPI000486AD2B|nr:hypothetical protein [Brachyspira alvinipulli]
MLIDNEKFIYCNDIISNDNIKNELLQLVHNAKNSNHENTDLEKIISNIESTISYNFKINNISEEQIDFLHILLKEYLYKYIEYNENITFDEINKYIYNIPNTIIDDIKNNNKLFPFAYILSIFYFCNVDEYFNDEFIKKINNIVFIENTDKIFFEDLFDILYPEDKKRLEIYL